ncbi:hypothetical protein M5K25_010988 [Dendrobium thyrsiflorum]|uniref:Uncharacterized protein n=1 Tax=Dendrobium thyrsiflorum TaxID=117978 RepID=A0ABD0V2Q2_DENTH
MTNGWKASQALATKSLTPLALTISPLSFARCWLLWAACYRGKKMMLSYNLGVFCFAKDNDEQPIIPYSHLLDDLLATRASSQVNSSTEVRQSPIQVMPLTLETDTAKRPLDIPLELGEPSKVAKISEGGEDAEGSDKEAQQHELLEQETHGMSQNPRLQRYLVAVEYIGTRFFGSQKQPNCRTVAGVLEAFILQMNLYYGQIFEDEGVRWKS